MSTLSAETFDSPAAYAAGLRDFLATDARAEPYIGYRAPSLEHAAQHLRGLQALIFDEGWSRLGWPQSAGGLGGDPRFRAAMFQTLWDLDIQVPEPFTTLEILVLVLLVFAPHLAEELLPGLLRGDDTWAQAFSEPDAGSDLASLRTRLEPDGDGYRLFGQKVWSTFGHLCCWRVLVAPATRG
jgi:alkylation response protein AidB-like acyl-CoA dehydrogenase